MHVLRPSAAALLALVLGGCAAFQSGDENLYYVYVPVGSTFEVTREIVVPAGQTRAFVPAGRAPPGTGRGGAICNFEVRTLSDGTRAIRPGAFHVTRVQTQPYVEVALREPLEVAALSLAGLELGDSDGALVAPTVHMYLFSAQQPDVMRLSCRGPFDLPSRARTPSIKQIRQALGDWVRLDLAPQGSGP